MSSSSRRIFSAFQVEYGKLTRADVLILLGITVVIGIGLRLAITAPSSLNGPTIDLSVRMLPYYAFLSLIRMLLAYCLSLTFSLVYGYVVTSNKLAERIMLPLLDILQSVPILSFLPVVLLGLTAILPQRLAVELAAVILIFTSQAWNLTFSFYQSLRTLPNELREASAVFRFNWYWRFRRMDLPFAALGLLWNSVMSWAGGWFFLMAAETFTVGQRDFRLPGLGSYLQAAAHQNNSRAILVGLGTLIIVVIMLDQLLWRPLLKWADKFKIEMVESDNPPSSWFFDLLGHSRLAVAFTNRVIIRALHWIDARLGRASQSGLDKAAIVDAKPSVWPRWLRWVILVTVAIIAVIGLWNILALMFTLPLDQYGLILRGVGATALRVMISLIIALLWTIPLGVAIGSNPQLANFLQPVVQIMASIPATAFFPMIFVLLIKLPHGLNLAAVLLMLLGTQWYLLFNIIAGTAAIPQDLRFTTDLLRFKGWNRWRKLVLPSLFPYLVTGLITAGGGAWNASIVAEYTLFNGQAYHVTGLGALISQATATGNFALLAASTLTMILAVVGLNRYFWRRLYKLAEEKYKME